MEGDLLRRLCILLFGIDGLDATMAMQRYNREYHVRLAACIPDVFSKVPLSALGMGDGVHLSAAHYNTP